MTAFGASGLLIMAFERLLGYNFKMKIINRYIVKEITAPLLLGFLVFTLIFLIDKTRELSELIVRYGVGFLPAVQLFAYVLPAYIAITVPMGLLFAVLFAFSRFNSDNEITAMKTNGVHVNSIAMPVIVFGLCISLLMVLFNGTLLPRSNLAFKKLYFNIVEKRANVAIQEKVFINDFNGFIFYVDKKDEKTGVLRNILVYVLEKSSSPVYTITAPEGLLASDKDEKRLILKLKNGSIHQALGPGLSGYNLINFDSYDIDLDINSALAGASNAKGFREMTFSELSEAINRFKENDIKDVTPQIEYHKKISIPFACLALTLTGIALGISVRLKGMSWSMIMSLALIVVYYYFLITGDALAQKGTLSPIMGMWLPNIVIGTVGAVLLLLAMREKIKF